MTDRASLNVLSTNVPLGHVPRCDNLCRPKEDGFPQSARRAAPAVVTGVGLRGGGGVRYSSRHDGGRVADRRLLYHR